MEWSGYRSDVASVIVIWGMYSKMGLWIKVGKDIVLIAPALISRKKKNEY
jgi:hypothetical protein